MRLIAYSNLSQMSKKIKKFQSMNYKHGSKLLIILIKICILKSQRQCKDHFHIL